MCLSWGLLNLLNSLRILKHCCLNNLVFPFSHDTPGIGPGIGKQFRASRKLCAVLQMASYLCFLVADPLTIIFQSVEWGKRQQNCNPAALRAISRRGTHHFPSHSFFPGLSSLASPTYKRGYKMQFSVLQPHAQLKLYYNGKNRYQSITSNLFC